MSISPLDVIFKPVTVRGFWMGHPEFAAKLAPAVVQAAKMIASGRLHIPVAGTYPSPPSKKLSRMRNAAERSFWTLPDHPPDLGTGISSLRPSGRPGLLVRRALLDVRATKSSIPERNFLRIGDVFAL
jgi:hypothetical protein